MRIAGINFEWHRLRYWVEMAFTPRMRKAYAVEKYARRAQRRGHCSVWLDGCETHFQNAGHLACLYRQIFLEHVYDFETSKEEPVIIDCGANIGLSTLRFKRRHPGARVHAFEPDPVLADIFERNIKSAGLGNVCFTRAAVWSSAGTLRFQQDAGLAGHLSSAGEAGGIEVPTVRLRELLSQPVDFLKLDIEGAELEVLRDCRDLLTNVRRLFVESHSYSGRRQTLDEILEILRGAGFRYWIGNIEAPPSPLLGTPFASGALEMCVNVFGTRTVAIERRPKAVELPAKPDESLLSAIIVTYNTCEMTLDCLQTLHESIEGLNYEVIVVDNASTDGSAAAIQEKFPKVRLIAKEENIGFGAANNEAMRLARGQFFLLLNSDAFPDKAAVPALLAFIREHPRAGAVGPRLLNADGSLQISCHPFPTPFFAWLENLWLARGYRGWGHDSVRHVDFVIGACMLVRRAAYERVGGFDESFFMYSEEADWQRRMKDAGWEVMFMPEARVKHLGGASGAREETRISRYFFESLDYYERKHHGLSGLIAFRLAMAVGCGLRTLLWTVAALLPARRSLALAKARKHSRLCLRQAFHWT